MRRACMFVGGLGFYLAHLVLLCENPLMLVPKVCAVDVPHPDSLYRGSDYIPKATEHRNPNGVK